MFRRAGFVFLAIVSLLSLAIACGQDVAAPKPGATPVVAETPEATDVSPPLVQEETRTFEELLISAAEYRSQRNLAAALNELALAELLVEDRSPENHDYLLLLLAEADTYVWFDRLDEAEAALLTATGIPDEYVDLISDSRNPLSEEEFRAIADEIQQLASENDLWGYHVALSLIYNVLGDTAALGIEQQAAMDVSRDQDMTLSIAMGLYRVRARKIEVHTALEQQELRVQQEPGSWVEKYELGVLYLYAGWLPEAQEIIDPYLSVLDPENDEEAYLHFLFLKMNLEMSLGHYDAMREYEAEILTIDPHAFDEFSQ